VKKRKFGLGSNDNQSLLGNPNFAICMPTLATFHDLFDPTELVNGKDYFHPHHEQHPENGKLWKDNECQTYCVKPQKTGLVGYYTPCNKKRKSSTWKAYWKEE
jgi:hypothetical protein